MNTKVCLLCRVSTQAQDYEYQVNLLTDIAKNRNWEVVKVFANKVSGAKKNGAEQVAGWINLSVLIECLQSIIGEI